jgi:hypothetical protein
MEWLHYAAAEFPKVPYRRETTAGLLTVAATYMTLPGTVAVDACDFGLMLCYFLYATQPDYAEATLGETANGPPADGAPSAAGRAGRLLDAHGTVDDRFLSPPFVGGDRELSDAARRLLSTTPAASIAPATIPVTPETMRIVKTRVTSPSASPELRNIAAALLRVHAFAVRPAVPEHSLALRELVRAHAALCPRPLVDEAASDAAKLADELPGSSASALKESLASYEALKAKLLDQNA